MLLNEHLTFLDNCFSREFTKNYLGTSTRWQGRSPQPGREQGSFALEKKSQTQGAQTGHKRHYRTLESGVDELSNGLIYVDLLAADVQGFDGLSPSGDRSST